VRLGTPRLPPRGIRAEEMRCHRSVPRALLIEPGAKIASET
jgi:hypothetical protein